MASWSSRRKFTYSSIVILLLIVVIIVPAFYFFYKAPTCFDGIKNGDEKGVDCGGSCVRLCQSSFLPPRIDWGGAKFEKVADGIYNVAAYIVNQNVSGAAIDVPYKMTLFDDKGIVIIEKRGKVTLYPHRNSLAFEPIVNVGKRIPAKATFEFTEAPIWFKSSDNLGGLVVIDKKYNEDEKGSSLEVVLENRTFYKYKNVLVSAVLFDLDGNVIGFSRTTIDSIDSKSGREIAPFTWPVNRKGNVTSIEVLPIIEPLPDR